MAETRSRLSPPPLSAATGPPARWMCASSPGGCLRQSGKGPRYLILFSKTGRGSGHQPVRPARTASEQSRVRPGQSRNLGSAGAQASGRVSELWSAILPIQGQPGNRPPLSQGQDLTYFSGRLEIASCSLGPAGLPPYNPNRSPIRPLNLSFFTATRCK